MAWRAARSLLVLHRQLQAGAPRARPPATGADEWGLVGDAAHDPTSDHTPHNFAGWGSQIVTAADFPNRPDLGLDAHQVLDDIRRSKDPRAKYGISNGEIFSNHAVEEHGRSYDPWDWRPYLKSNGTYPADRHFTHGHLSTVGDIRADGEQPWHTIGATMELPRTATKVSSGRNRTDVDALSDLERMRLYFAGEMTLAEAGFGGDSPLAKLTNAVLNPVPALTVTREQLVDALGAIAPQIGSAMVDALYKRLS